MVFRCFFANNASQQFKTVIFAQSAQGILRAFPSLLKNEKAGAQMCVGLFGISYTSYRAATSFNCSRIAIRCGQRDSQSPQPIHAEAAENASVKR